MREIPLVQVQLPSGARPSTSRALQRTGMTYSPGLTVGHGPQQEAWHLQVFSGRHQHSDEGVPHPSHRAGHVREEEEICVWVEDLPCGLLGKLNKWCLSAQFPSWKTF